MAQPKHMAEFVRRHGQQIDVVRCVRARSGRENAGIRRLLELTVVLRRRIDKPAETCRVSIEGDNAARGLRQPCWWQLRDDPGHIFDELLIRLRIRPPTRNSTRLSVS